MDEAIEHRVRQGGLPNRLMPMVHGELTGHHRRPAVIGLALGSLLRGAVGIEKWRHIWVGCSYQCANVIPADGRYGADGDNPA